MEKRLQQIELRRTEIGAEIAEATEERLAELEAEVTALETEEKEIRAKQELLVKVTTKEDKPVEGRQNTVTAEERAKNFAETNKMQVEARSLLFSGGTIATPQGAQEEINSMQGPRYSSIVDLMSFEDATGMGAYVVPYVSAEGEAYDSTEGSANSTESGATFGKVTLTPAEISTLAYISKQIAKTTPTKYEEKTKEVSKNALRRKLSAKAVNAVYSSSLIATKEVAKNTTSGVAITESTLRDIVFAYDGDEGVDGSAVLFLNKTDLTAFGKVRGTNEKKAVYEITPNAGNPNTGVIKDGGTIVNYCINSNVTAFDGCRSASTKTMMYGNPKNILCAMWGDVEIETSKDYKFAEGLLSVRGDLMGDVDLVVKNGFVVLKTGA